MDESRNEILSNCIFNNIFNKNYLDIKILFEFREKYVINFCSCVCEDWMAQRRNQNAENAYATKCHRYFCSIEWNTFEMSISALNEASKLLDILEIEQVMFKFVFAVIY